MRKRQEARQHQTPVDHLDPGWEPGTPRLEAAIGIDAFRDAAAAIRALAARDSEGMHAVINGTDAPRHVAGALATLAVLICHRSNLDDAQIRALLDELTVQLFDAFLDQANGTLGEV